jgi:hypothetical protein
MAKKSISRDPKIYLEQINRHFFKLNDGGFRITYYERSHGAEY